MMTCVALKIDHPPGLAEQTDAVDASAAPEATAVHESLFVTFAEEIDAWARQALAANGFGDST